MSAIMYLNIQIKSAQLHRDVELIGQMAPYVIVTDYYGVQFKRTSLGSGKNPTWNNENFKISAKIPALIFQVYDYERIKGSDDFVGKGETKTQGWATQLNVPVPGNTNHYVVNVPLYWEGQVAGTLNITITMEQKVGTYNPSIHVPEFAKLPSFKKQRSTGNEIPVYPQAYPSQYQQPLYRR